MDRPIPSPSAAMRERYTLAAPRARTLSLQVQRSTRNTALADVL